MSKLFKHSKIDIPVISEQLKVVRIYHNFRNIFSVFRNYKISILNYIIIKFKIDYQAINLFGCCIPNVIFFSNIYGALQIDAVKLVMAIYLS